MSILEEMLKYARSLPSRFHTPGHKGAATGSALDAILPLDITELPFSDDYFNPSGIIRASMDKARSFYRSAETFLLVNGSTIGLLAAIRAAIQFTTQRSAATDRNYKPASIDTMHVDYHQSTATSGDIQASSLVVVAGECHRAVLSGITLANAQLEHCASTAQEIAQALDASGARVVVVTSPDYYGRCVDLSAIAAECHARGAVLIADASHGAHFAASKLFPNNSGADISVCSAHKTMHALTQGSFLNVYNGELVNAVRDALHLFASTSPSYLIMASLEYAIDYAIANEQRYIDLHKLVNIMREQIPLERNDDFTRLVVRCDRQDGAEVYRRLCEQGIFAEKYDDERVIFILTAADDQSSVQHLSSALIKILQN